MKRGRGERGGRPIGNLYFARDKREDGDKLCRGNLSYVNYFSATVFRVEFIELALKSQ